MKTYGMPYMGSKRKLATRILAAMPKRDTLVDLFCGGCAVAHAAMDGNKFKNIIINDINPMCPELFINALSGKYNDEKRWISREDFERLKYTDPYVAVVWSFGNNLRDYLYSRDIEPLKRAMHYAIYFGDTHPLTDILTGIDLLGLSDVTEERDRYLSVKHRVEEYLHTHRIAANSNMQHFTASSLIADETGGVQIITKESRTATHRTETTYPSHESSMRNGRNGCCRSETNRWGVQIQSRTVDARTHQQATSPTSCGCNTESTTPGCFNYSSPNGGGQIKAFSMDYRKVEIPSSSVIYCDIPYEKTQTYGTEKQHFNHAEFYEWCAEQREPLFISSYSLPYENFVCIAEFPHRSTLSATANKKVVERLFVPLHQKERGLKQLKLFE